MPIKGFDTRRDFLRSAIAGAGLLLSACHADSRGEEKPAAKQKQTGEAMGGEVTATEDLMREHGVLRRALIVYSEAAIKLRGGSSLVPPDALQRTAKLFRDFGEEYHEKKL